jgi:hypothetical protein
MGGDIFQLQAKLWNLKAPNRDRSTSASPRESNGQRLSYHTRRACKSVPDGTRARLRSGLSGKHQSPRDDAARNRFISIAWQYIRGPRSQAIPILCAVLSRASSGADRNAECCRAAPSVHLRGPGHVLNGTLIHIQFVALALDYNGGARKV